MLEDLSSRLSVEAMFVMCNSVVAWRCSFASELKTSVLRCQSRKCRHVDMCLYECFERKHNIEYNDDQQIRT